MKALNPIEARASKRPHYPLDMILTCVRWYAAYPFSLRNMEDVMAGRSISVDHSTVHRWALQLAPVLEKASRRHKCPVDKADNTIDFLLRVHRDKTATRR